MDDGRDETGEDEGIDALEDLEVTDQEGDNVTGGTGKGPVPGAGGASTSRLSTR